MLIAKAEKIAAEKSASVSFEVVKQAMEVIGKNSAQLIAAEEKKKSAPTISTALPTQAEESVSTSAAEASKSLKQSSAAAAESVEQSAAPAVQEEEEDPGVQRMKSVLNSMLAKLQKQIDSTEKVVGDRLSLLDKDGDGTLSAQELRDAIVSLLRKNYSVEEAEQLVNILDNDKDGKGDLIILIDNYHL